jgi:hypothetical protein
VRRTLALLVAAAILFALAAVGTLRAVEIGSRPLALAGAVGMFLSGVCFVLAAWLPRRGVDWKRIEAEQRLWESGPLGRRWLHVRRRLADRFRL